MKLIIEAVMKIKDFNCPNLFFEKWCLQGGMYWYYLSNIQNFKLPDSTFKALFELPRWMEMWDKSELGWWYALGLLHYGPECIELYIQQTFKDKRSTSLVSHANYSPKRHILTWLLLPDQFKTRT